MTKRCLWAIGITALLVFAMSLSAFGQGAGATTGNLSGVVTDSTGAVIPDAKVTVTGPIGSRTFTTQEDGRFTAPALIPGTYSIKVEKQGFRVADVKNVEIAINKTSSVTIGMQPGSTSEVVEVSAAAVTVDTTSTAVGTNLSDQFYQAVPTARGVAGLFYASAGVASGGGTGASNPSISGGSGLENLYVADGVDITDTSFGGLGTYNRVFGSVGTGINLSFIKEVQVKTGGYEPQYGKSTGGIVQIVTKSGTNEYHGALTGFFAPQSFEATRKHGDDFGRTNLLGKRVHNEAYDASAELSGYVPGFKDNLFFFGSINPSWNRNIDLAPSIFGLSNLGEMTLRTNTFNYSAKLTYKLSDAHQLESSIFGDPAHTSNGAFLTLITDNPAAFTKLDYGSRNWVARYNGTFSPTWLMNISFSWMNNRFDESTTDTFNGIPNYQVTNLTETSGLAGQRGSFRLYGQGFYENTRSDNYGFDVNTTKVAHFGGEHSFGIGYKLELPRYDPYKDRSGPKFAIPATNANNGDYGADPSVVGLPDNATWELRRLNSCTLCPTMTIPGYATPQHVYLRQNRGEFGALQIHTEGTYHAAFVNDAWTLNKFVTLNLGLRWEQHKLTGTSAHYTFTDNWSPRLGVSIDPIGDRKTKLYANFGRYNYAIPLDMAERSLSDELDFYGLRLMPDFVGTGTNKTVVLNSLGTVTVVPDAAHVLNNFNSRVGVDLDPDTGACINAAGCGTGGAPAFSTQSVVAFNPGTRMQYLDEFVVGGEREIWGGVILSARYIDRRIKRIVEDLAGISPEGFNAGLTQNYFIANPGPNSDFFHNEHPVKFNTGSVPSSLIDPTVYPGLVTADAASCPGSWNSTSGQCKLPSGYILDPVTDSFGNTVSPGGVGYIPVDANGKPFVGPWYVFSGDPGEENDPSKYDLNPAAFWGGEVGPDGTPDGFVRPVREYQAVEIEANKGFSKNWLMRLNWRISRLRGNYEGAFRNDNGQSDPSISSLFDFTEGVYGLLGSQFETGVLNTDRRHVVNGFFSYAFDKTALRGLTLGTGIRVESGYPFNDLKAHPAYLNAGEIPAGGRGALGRSPVTGSVDIKAEYAHSLTERTRLRLGADLFNIVNSKTLLAIDQNEDLSFGTANIDFQKPANFAGRDTAFQRPFYARFMVKLEF